MDRHPFWPGIHATRSRCWQRRFLWVRLALVLVLLVACRPAAPTPQAPPAATPTPVPTATALPPTPTATPAATATPKPTLSPPIADGTLPADWVGYSSSRGGFTWFLPPQWEMVDMTAEDVDAHLARLRERLTNADLQRVLEQFQAARDAVAAVALLADVAALQDARFVPNISAMVLPGHGITLSLYVETVGRQLDQQALSALIEAGVVDGWREGTPVALLDYTVDGTAYDLADLTIRGQQVAFYDTDGERLLIVTFTTPAGRFDELLPTFRQIVGSIAFR